MLITTLILALIALVGLVNDRVFLAWSIVLVIVATTVVMSINCVVYVIKWLCFPFTRKVPQWVPKLVNVVYDEPTDDTNS